MTKPPIQIPSPNIPKMGFHGFKKRFTEGWNDRLIAEFNHRLNGIEITFKNPFGPVHLARSYEAGWFAVSDVDIDQMIVMNDRAASNDDAGRRLFNQTRQRLFGKRYGASHVG
jgi:hypothetical protein